MDEPGPREPSSAAPEAPTDRVAILPLLAGYWSFGQYWGFWVILVFEFQGDHSISDSRLGVLYTLLSIVAVLVMLLGAPRLQRLPLSTSVPTSLLCLAVGAATIGLFPTSLIWVGFVLVGAGNGLIDVYLNVAAQRAEVATSKPVLQWLHASYALGGVTGAACAGLLIALHVDFRLGLAAAAIALAVTASWNARTASHEPGSHDEETKISLSPLIRSPALWVPAIAILFAFLVEGSMDTWSGLYLRGQLGASGMLAAMAFVAFAASTFLGRLFAGRVLFRLGHRTTILVSGAASAVAGTLAVITDQIWIVGIAYLLLGFSLSAAAPAAYGLVEGIDDNASQSIAAVTTIGYTGFIWSPPLLGYIADTVSLRAAMTVVVFATFGIIIAGVLARDDRSSRAAKS
jgi:cyanate permease